MKSGWKWFTYVAAGVVIVWELFFLFTFHVQSQGKISDFGNIGDAFNILNAMFAGLAFAAICFQLWTQQAQIDQERQDRYRADRISALATRIQVTFQKILYERELLLPVAPGFKNVSFLHEGDGLRAGEAIEAREGLVISLSEAIRVSQLHPAERVTHPSYDVWKQLLDNQAALPMMKQIKKWVDQLESYEKEMDGLLKVVSKVEKEN